MRLWTWQSKDFSLADKNQKFESLKHSCYLKNLKQNEKEKHQEAYKKVFQKLGDQLIWCFTDYRDATVNGSIKEFEKNCNCLLWELDMPEDEIKWYCPAAWETLRIGKPKMSSGIHKIFQSYKDDLKEEAEKYENEFNEFWSDKTIEELLHLMFLKKPVFNLGLPNAKTLRCSDGAIVIHPVDKDSIKKNPKEKEFNKWWKISEENNSSLINDENLLKMIPCRNCPGRL